MCASKNKWNMVIYIWNIFWQVEFNFRVIIYFKLLCRWSHFVNTVHVFLYVLRIEESSAVVCDLCVFDCKYINKRCNSALLPLSLSETQVSNCSWTLSAPLFNMDIQSNCIWCCAVISNINVIIPSKLSDMFWATCSTIIQIISVNCFQLTMLILCVKMSLLWVHL